MLIYYVSSVTTSVPKIWKKPKEDALVEQAHSPDREVRLGHIVGPVLCFYWTIPFINFLIK